MKYCTLLLFTAAVVAISQCYSVEWPQEGLGDESQWEPAGEVTEEHLTRLKRATCDLFSFSSKWVTPNHSACAAHCLLKGKKGGSCKGTICHCRN